MEKKGQIKFGAIITYISNISNIAITVILTPLIIRLVGQSEYGLYSLVSSLMAYFSVLDFGFGNAMIRYVSKFRTQKKDDKNINSLFFIIYSIIGILTLIIGIIVYFNLSNIFGQSLTDVELQKANVMMLIFLIGTAISFPLSVFDSYVLANERFIFLKFINLLRILLYPVIIIPLLIVGYKAIAIVIVYTVLNLLMHITYALYSLIKLKMKLTLKIKNIDFSIFKEIIMYSFFVFLNIIVDTVFNNTDQVILGIVSGTTAVAIYSTANQIKNANNLFSTAISGLFLPRITKLLTLGKKEEIDDVFINVSKIQLYIMLLVLSGFYIFGRKFITLWVGIDYIDAYYITLWLIGFSIVPLTQNLGISVLQAMNKHKFRAIMYIIIAIINIGISIPLAKVYQGVGVAIGSAIANLLGQCITMNIYYYKVAKLDIPTYWKNFIKICIPVFIFSIIITPIINYLCINSWIKLIISIAIYTMIYIIYIYIVHLNKEEKEYISKKIKRKII